MSKVAVVYFTSTGNTEIMADKIVEGIKNKGNEVDKFNSYDFSADMINDYDAFAFGCPATGAEQLDGEFELLFDECTPNLIGKRVGLFGSYDWGDGEWMRIWEETAKEKGVDVVSTLIINLAPDIDGERDCVKFGEDLI